MQRKVPDTSAVREPKSVDITAASRHIVGCVTGHAFSQLSYILEWSAGRSGEWVLTLINGGKTFSHPVTAAAKLNPQSAVGGNDWLGQLIPTETTWVTGEDTHTHTKQDLIILTPAIALKILHTALHFIDK